jgi:hypothetical protein
LLPQKPGEIPYGTGKTGGEVYADSTDEKFPDSSGEYGGINQLGKRGK